MNVSPLKTNSAFALIQATSKSAAQKSQTRHGADRDVDRRDLDPPGTRALASETRSVKPDAASSLVTVRSADRQPSLETVKSSPYHFIDMSVSVPSLCMSLMISPTASANGTLSASELLSKAAAKGS